MATQRLRIGTDNETTEKWKVPYHHGVCDLTKGERYDL